MAILTVHKNVDALTAPELQFSGMAAASVT
jgi:hypothetical protein